jgi:hypothetical protein
MNFTSLYKQLPWDKRMLIASALLALIPLGFYLFLQPTPTPPAAATASLETHIPKGFVLVPIEIENYESLDSVFGQFGIVDLFQKAGVIARNVRLLRAPNNPGRFAVLVPEREAERLLRQGSVFSVTVKRNQAAGTEFVNEPKVRSRAITYEGG